MSSRSFLASGSVSVTLGALAVMAMLVGCATEAPAGYEMEVFVAKSHFHGIHGLTFDADDQLLAGSVVGQTTYQVDPESGEVTVRTPPPEGMADDLEFGPAGQLVWTSFLAGRIHSQHPGQAIRVVASGLPGINSLAFKEDGRLFATQVFLGDALYEIDPSGADEPRQILAGIGGLNGFDFGPDGLLYGPLWFRGRVVRIDVDSGVLETVADGFEVPAAVNFDSKGQLWVVDTARGEVVRVDPESGAKTVVARVRTAIDNLALDSRDRLFISNMADNGIYEVDTGSGEVRTVVEGRLSVPSDLALWAEDGKETLYLADLFAFRTIDTETGTITDVARMYGDELENPMSVAVGADHVLLTSWYTGNVQRLDRRSGESLGVIGGFQAPGALLLLDDGSFLVGEIGSGRLLLVGDGSSEPRTVIDGLQLPVGLAPADHGRVYLAEAGAGSVSVIELASGSKRVLVTGLLQPEGIAVAPDGRLIVAEVGRRTLTAVDPETGSTEVLAADLPIGLPGTEGTPPTSVPTGVAVSESGTIYLSCDLGNAIYRFVPTG